MAGSGGIICSANTPHRRVRPENDLAMLDVVRWDAGYHPWFAAMTLLAARWSGRG